MGRSIFQSEAIDGRLQSTSATRAHAKRMRAEQNWCCEHAQVADACQDCVPSKIQARRVGPVSSFHPCRYGTHGYPQRGAAPSGAHHNGSRSGSTTASATRDERTVIANLLERRGRREGADDDAARDASFSELVERSLVDIRARGRRRPAAGSSTNAFQDTSESPPPPRQHPHYTYAHDARIQRLLDAHLEHRHLPSPSSRDIPIESGASRSNGFRSEIPPSDDVAILRTNLASHETEGASSSSTPRTTAGVAQFLDVSRPPHASRSRPDERHYTTAEDLIRSSREVSEENIPSAVWRSIQRDLTQMRDVRSPETHPAAREAILSGSGSVRRGIEALFPYSDDMDSDYELDLDVPRRGASPGATAPVRDLPASSTTRAASIRRYRALARYSSSGPSAINGAAGEERSSSMGTTAPAAHSAAWNFSNIPPHEPPSLPADTLPAMIFPLPQPQPRARPGTEDYRTEPTAAAAAETNADEYNHWAARSIPEEEEEAMLQDDLSAFERLLDGHTLNPEQSIAHLRMLADRVRRVYDFGRVRVPPSVTAARTQQQQQQGSGDVAGSAQRWYRRPAFSGDEYFAAERLQSSRPWGRSAPSTSAREEEDSSAQSQQGRALRFMDRETAARTLVGGEGEEASSRNVTGEAGPSVPRLSEWEMMHSATNEGGEGEGEQGGRRRRRRRRSRDPSPCPTIQNAADAQMQIDEVSPTSSSSSTSPPSTLPSAGSSSREAESTSTSAPPSPPLTTTHNENATRVRRDGGSGGSDCPEIENNASRTTTAGSSSSGRIMEQMHRMMMAQPNRGPMPPAPAPLSRE